MRVYYGFEQLPTFVRPVVTVGVYDGVHRGHQSLLGCLIDEAHAASGESVVITFDTHPRVLLGHGDGLRLLTTLEEKIVLFEQMGVDNVVVIPFDTTFSALTGREFVARYLVDAVGAEVLVVGYDHHFGHDRIGFEELRQLADLRVIRVDECHVEGVHVSSTVIRHLLDEGCTAEAEHLLGHSINNIQNR